MTKNEARLMRSFLRWPDEWQPIGDDARATVKTLERHGMVELVRHRTRNWRAKLKTGSADNAR